MSIDHNHSVDGAAVQANSSQPKSAESPENNGLAAAPSVNESELKYQRLVEGISGDYIIYTHDPDGVMTYVSPSVEAVLGYPVESVVGINWRELVGEHFVGRDLADRVADEVAAGKKFYKFQVEISHADGSTRLIEIQQRPIFDADGNYTSMEGISKDITAATRDAEELKKLKEDLEQRVAERTAELIRSNERLRESESRYRNVVDCQTEFVVRWLPGAVFTFVNEAFCRLVGKSSDQLIGWSFLPLVHPDEAPAFAEVIANLSEEQPYADFENRIVLPDGRHVWTHWTNQMLFDDAGNFLEYQSVGRDITELRQAADMIREKEAHLAHMSRLATMGELVAGMAHEIHQPLHAAKTFAEAARRNLEMGVANGEIPSANPVATAIDCAKEISNAISRTAKIIRRLREFTHSRPVKLDELDMNQVVQEATELIAYETRTARVKLLFELVSGIPVVQGDRIQLQQACVNLLINAYEAMADTPVEQRKILISTQYDRWHVRLGFEDVGCGIAEEEYEKLFDAFYTTKEQGMGMGLSLCKSIAEAHGGNILPRRNEGVGTTFVLELPIMQRPSSVTKTSDRSSE